MSKIPISSIAFMSILLLCAFWVLLFASPVKTPEEDVPPAETLILKDYRGRLALFSGESTQPLKVFDTYVSALPVLDRQRLALGIAVSDGETLWELLQDFLQ